MTKLFASNAQKFNAMRLVSKLSDNGISFKSETMLHYFCKTIVFCLCVVGCVWQIGTILKLYFDHPSNVFVDVQPMKKLLLPGITLCNNNRLVMSKLQEYDQEFGAKWSLLLNATNTLNDYDLKLQQQALIDKSMRNLMNKLTVSEFMNLGHFVSDFIVPEFFKCASDRVYPNQQCIKFSKVITTAQDIGNCFTLFHRSRSEILNDIAIDSGLSQSPVKRGNHSEAINIEISEMPFHPNEIVRLKLNFQSEEYTTLNEPVFARIAIHDDDIVPVIREKSFILFPGHYYEFFISKRTDLLLPSPYATDCIKYKDLVSDGSDDINEYLHHPQSKENCIIGCMAQNTMDVCHCWPPELPFMKGSKRDAMENALKWCDWDTKPPIDLTKAENTTWFQFCFTQFESQCNYKCKSDCRIDRYLITKETRVWPAIERIEHSKHGDYLYEMRKCCAIVSIRYWSSELTINQYQPKFEIAELNSYLGGLLSMWLGISLIGSYRLFETLVIHVHKYLEKDCKSTNLKNTTSALATVYDPRSVYDTQYRGELRRDVWKRKARVATIMSRVTKISKPQENILRY